MISVTYGYARVSKAERDEKNLETQLNELDKYGIRRDLIFVDDATGMNYKRPGWEALMERVQPGNVIVAYNIARLGKTFYESVTIQADLTRRGIWIVGIQDRITTVDENAGARFYRRMMLANGAFHAETTSEQILAGLERAKKQGKTLGRPPALGPERQQEARNIYTRTKSIRATAREMKVSHGPVKKALGLNQVRVGRAD